MEDVTEEELSGMIADLSLTDEWPDRTQLCHALIELRDLRRRWRMFVRCFPWMECFMMWLARRRSH